MTIVNAIKEDNYCFHKENRTSLHDFSHQVTAEHWQKQNLLKNKYW